MNKGESIHYMNNNKISQILSKQNINGFDLPGGTDKANPHSYDEFYSNFLDKYTDKEGTILEIGVAYGGSSLMWHEYLPKFNLIMMDIQNIVHPTIWDKMSKERYEFIEMDAFKNEAIELLKQKYPEGFDIIIEDGPHDVVTQSFALKEYSKLLKKGGVLIVEDIQNFNSIQPLISQVPSDVYSSLNFCDFREVKGRYDDLIIVLNN